MAEDAPKVGLTDRWRLNTSSGGGGTNNKNNNNTDLYSSSQPGVNQHFQINESPGNSQNASSKPKRSQACVSCRKQKMKCQFSEQSDPPRCDRCRQANLECKFEIRANDKQWTSSVEERLKRLEDTLSELMDLLQNNNVWGASPIGEGHWSNQSYNLLPNSASEKSGPSGAGTGGITNTLKRAHATKDMANGLLSGLIGSSRRGSSSGTDNNKTNDNEDLEDDGTDFPPAKRSRLELDDTSLVESAEARECIEFFNAKLARYLPILVFKYLPQFDISVQKRSPLLLLSILSVASLYHPAYQSRHNVFRKEFETVADSLDYSALASGDSNFNQVIDVVVALSLAGAWLGGELGFRMSITASNLAGTVFPLEQEKTSPSDKAKLELISAIGLMTYIIEQRLRIIHARPIDPNQIVNGKRRDIFFAQFLASLMSYRKGQHHEMDVAELKITANVELCAVILMLQLDLRYDVKMDVLTHWNNQLDKWLSEWMGKLTVNLLPSSWKPVFLTFHFAKLFLNSMAVSNVKPLNTTWTPPIDPNMTPEDREKFTKAAENSALDILDMLVRDRDIERLIAVAPVFYPTIFITACALLLKLLTISKSVDHPIDEGKVIKVIRSSHNILSTKLAAPVLPSNPSVRNLGAGLEKVSGTIKEDHSASSSPVEQQQQRQPQTDDRRTSYVRTQPAPHIPAPQQITPTPIITSNKNNSNTQPTPSGVEEYPGSEAAGILPTNFWSFTPFRAKYNEDNNLTTAQFPTDNNNNNNQGFPNIWQSSRNQAINDDNDIGNTDFLFDAYSSSILDSLTGGGREM